GLAFLFAIGARNYIASEPFRFRCGVHEMLRLELVSDPPGATVERLRDHHTVCVTPCAVGIEAEPGVSGFRFALAGHHDRTARAARTGRVASPARAAPPRPGPCWGRCRSGLQSTSQEFPSELPRLPGRVRVVDLGARVVEEGVIRVEDVDLAGPAGGLDLLRD